MKYIARIELLLIGLWLGAAVFFSFGVAPSAFGVLPSRELAGSVVNRTLTIVNFAGLIIGLLLILSSFIPRNDTRKFWIWLQRLFLFIVTLASGAGQLIIGVYLSRLRTLIGRPIEELASDDPLRLNFNWWHELSVRVLIAGMIAALLAFFIISRRSSGKPETASKNDIPDFELPDELKM